MMADFRHSFLYGILRHALPQTIILMVLGTAAGFALNRTRLDPLKLDAPGTQLLTESGAPAILTGKARELFDEGLYIFVDAREEDAFQRGHIQGALCLPYARFSELYPLLREWTGGQPLLVYGSATDIVTADDVARRLFDIGEEEVVLLATGYEAWVARGYPSATGEEGLLVEDDWDDEDWDE